jgi:hypothetical protein
LGGFQAAPDVSVASYRKFDTPLTRRRAFYVLGQFAVVLLGTSLLLFREGDIPRSWLVAGALFVTASLVALGGLLEGRRWAWPLEAMRMAALAGLVLVSCDGRASERPYGEFLVAVGRETFVLRATDAETVRLAAESFRGRANVFPIGPLRRGNGGFNGPWSWHFDPERVRMAELAIEVCDGQPSYVETHLEDFLGGYCPWGARVVALR